jgi:ankyrin repeat protein
MRKVAHLRLFRKNNMTILHWASDHRFIRVVEGLLEAGASVDALDQNGASPLMYVSESGYLDLAECLIVHGASWDLRLNKETPLTKAAHFNNSAVFDLFFRHGAKIDRQYWWTILSAASQGHIQIVRILLLTGGVDVNFRLTAAPDEIPSCAHIYIGRTTVHLAVCNQHPEMVAFLIDNGADINAQNHGTTPIQHLIPKWPHLSSAEERCLYELCGRHRWRTIWWNFSRLLGFIITPIRSPEFIIRSLEFIIRSLEFVITRIRSLGQRRRREHRRERRRRGRWSPDYPSCTCCCNRTFWTACVGFFFVLGWVGIAVAIAANIIAGVSILGVAFGGFIFSGFMIVHTS